MKKAIISFVVGMAFALIGCLNDQNTVLFSIAMIAALACIFPFIASLSKATTKEAKKTSQEVHLGRAA